MTDDDWHEGSKALVYAHPGGHILRQQNIQHLATFRIPLSKAVMRACG